MKTNRFILMVLVIMLQAILVGCGTLPAQPTSTSVPMNTPIPTSTSVPTNTPANMPPKLGHYIGTNPDVSFDLTSRGIENFSITIPWNEKMCYLASSKTLNINQNGSFSTKGNAANITGKINGGNVNGDFSLSICLQGSQGTAFFPAYLGKWIASLKGQNEVPSIDSNNSSDVALATENGIPIIQSVNLRKDSSSGELKIYQDISFTDNEGDVTHVDYKIISATVSGLQVEGGTVDITSTAQKSGAVISGEWGCGNENYSVTLRVTLTDNAGNNSKPFDYTMVCEAGN